MNLSEAVQFSLQSLRANPLRTFLTALGLIIGNASVILVVTISLVGKDFILDQIRGVGSNLVYASYETGGQNMANVQADFIKLADVQAVRNTLGSEIVAATAVMPSNDRIVMNGRERDVTIIGTDDQYSKVRKLVVLAGRTFDSSDVTLREHVAMLTEGLSKRLYQSPELAIGQVIKLHQLRFTIVGVFREKTTTFGQTELQEETAMIPLSVAKDFAVYERVDPMYVQARYAEDVPRVTQEIHRILESRHRAGAKYNIQNLKAILDTANAISVILTIVLMSVSALALVISGNRNHEYHARDGDGTNARNRAQEGRGRVAKRDFRAIPHGVAAAQRRRRILGRPDRNRHPPGSYVSHIVQHSRFAPFDTCGAFRFGFRRHRLRHAPRFTGGKPESYRSSAIRIIALFNPCSGERLSSM